MSRDSDLALEKDIKARNLNAPRVTVQQVDEVITGEAYYVFPETTVTVCCLTLKNGFNVVGKSAAASPENFDTDIGKRVAREDARSQIWQLEGYLLKESLYQDAVADDVPDDPEIV